MKQRMRKYVWGEDAEVSGPRNYFRESLIISALKRYAASGKILDAGCGTGSLSVRLITSGYNLVSLDSSALSLHHLKDKIKRCSLRMKIVIKRGSILKLPFKNNFFDGVVCGEVLEHIKNDRKAIAEIHRVLKSGSVCVATVPAHPKNWDVSDEISNHKRRYKKEELRKRFKNAGFRVLQCTYVGFPLNNLWHTYLFVPFLQHKMKHKVNKKRKMSLFSSLIENVHIQELLSKIFYFDFLFSFFNKGNMLLIVAAKI